MHPNPAFRAVETECSLAFVRDEAFGVLTMTAFKGPPRSAFQIGLDLTICAPRRSPASFSTKGR